MHLELMRKVLKRDTELEFPDLFDAIYNEIMK